MILPQNQLDQSFSYISVLINRWLQSKLTQNVSIKMLGSVTRDSHEWVYSDQPHSARRGLMLAKYPLIKKYMCADPHFKPGMTLF